MRVLFIGGTGIISTACTQLAAQRGIDLTLATRGRRAATDLPAGVKTLTIDMDDAAGAAQALADQHVRRRGGLDRVHARRRSSATCSLFRGRTAPVHFHQLGQRLSEAFDATT